MITKPAASSPARIADEVLAAISALPQVRRVALFGSLAVGTIDCWSDVDMIVACENVAATEWAVAKAITEAKPIIYYRKFSTANPPSGRYWFVAESPFHRLDVSFVSTDAYQARMADPALVGPNVTLREVYSADWAPSVTPATESKRFLHPASDDETQIGTYIYFTLEAIKLHLRGQHLSEKKLSGMAGLRAIIPTLPRHTTMPGGRIGELAHQAHEILQSLPNTPSNPPHSELNPSPAHNP